MRAAGAGEGVPEGALSGDLSLQLRQQETVLSQELMRPHSGAAVIVEAWFRIGGGRAVRLEQLDEFLRRFHDRHKDPGLHNGGERVQQAGVPLDERHLAAQPEHGRLEASGGGAGWGRPQRHDAAHTRSHGFDGCGPPAMSLFHQAALKRRAYPWRA